jgi:hypothetical protein
MIPLEIIPTAEDGSNLRDSREEYAKKVQIGECEHRLTPSLGIIFTENHSNT